MGEYQRALSQHRKAQRRLVNGRLVAGDHVRHGTRSTYNGWHCRCDPCREAYNASRPSRKK